MDENNRAEIPAKNRASGWHLWVLLAGILGIGIYCQFLNQTLYLKKAPFFDSLRYYDRLYDVVSLSQQKGILAAAKDAIEVDSTFCLPYLIAVPFGMLLEPSRAIGVWIEVIYFAVFVFSFSAYLRKVRQAEPKVILGCLVPIFLLGALYRSTTGLSDFRVDLPMAFLYASTACWWLMGQESQRWNHFLAAGLCAGLACLSRAIAPVYFVCGFVPLIIYDLLYSDERKKRIVQFGLIVGIAIATSIWFYLIHFKFLHFYYVLWNTDANATISYSRSLRHFVAVLKSIGPASAVFFVFVFLFTRNLQRKVSAYESSLGHRKNLSRDLLWFGWLALAPVLLLIAKRADINPFVSLPGAIALIVCWIVSQIHRIQQVIENQPSRFALASAGLLLVTMITGYLDHTKNQPATAAGHREVLQIVQRDMQARQSDSNSFAVNLLTAMSSESLESMLQYDFNSRYLNETTLVVDGLRLRASHKFLMPAAVNWDRAAGDTVAEKIKMLEQSAAAEIDYLVAPTFDSIPVIQTKYDYSYSSRFAEPILTRFQNSGNWKSISDAILIEPGIHVRVYRNTGLAKRVVETDIN